MTSQAAVRCVGFLQLTFSFADFGAVVLLVVIQPLHKVKKLGYDDDDAYSRHTSDVSSESSTGLLPTSPQRAPNVPSHGVPVGLCIDRLDREDVFSQWF